MEFFFYFLFRLICVGLLIRIKLSASVNFFLGTLKNQKKLTPHRSIYCSDKTSLFEELESLALNFLHLEFLIATMIFLYRKKTCNTRNYQKLYTFTKKFNSIQAVVIVVEIEDWNGKHGRFWEFRVNRFCTDPFSQNRTALNFF
jgi:hypothetical protein